MLCVFCLEVRWVVPFLIRLGDKKTSVLLIVLQQTANGSALALKQSPLTRTHTQNHTLIFVHTHLLCICKRRVFYVGIIFGLCFVSDFMMYYFFFLYTPLHPHSPTPPHPTPQPYRYFPSTPRTIPAPSHPDHHNHPKHLNCSSNIFALKIPSDEPPFVCIFSVFL